MSAIIRKRRFPISSRVLARAITIGALAGLVLNGARAVRLVAVNDYRGAGLHRIIPIELIEALTAGALAGAGVLLLLALVYLALRRRGEDRADALAGVTALALAASPWLWYGYRLNRAHLKEFWKRTVDIGGAAIPAGFAEAYPLLLNGLITLGAAGLLFLLARLLRPPFRRLFPERGIAPARRFAPWRTAVLLTALLLLGNFWLQKTRRAEGFPVILVSIDTLRAGHLGCYGYGRDTSPNLDRFAGEGVRFDRCISQAPVTLPAHMSILTSSYPTAHGVVTSGSRLGEKANTLAEILRNEGYATAGFVDGGYMTGRFGFYQGFQVYQDRSRGVRELRRRAMNWIGRHRDERFFCFLHFYDVHSPYDPPPPYDGLFLRDGLASRFDPTSRNLRMYDKFYAGEGEDELEPLTDEDVERMVALYDGGIRYADAEMGAFFDDLKAAGLYDRALIVVTSDHGEEFLEHRTLLHSELYSTVVDVPLLVRPPSSMTGSPGMRGETVLPVVESVDILPTILDLLGVRTRIPFAGESLLSPAGGTGGEGSGAAFSEHRWKGRLRSLTTPDYKLIRALDEERLELYRTGVDRVERNDLSEEEAEIAAELGLVLQGWIDEQEKIGGRSGAPAESGDVVDEDILDQLRALGYVD